MDYPICHIKTNFVDSGREWSLTDGLINEIPNLVIEEEITISFFCCPVVKINISAKLIPLLGGI